MTRETKSYELKIYDQSLMRFEAAYDAFGSLKLEITETVVKPLDLSPIGRYYRHLRRPCGRIRRPTAA